MEVCIFDIDGVLNFYPDCWVDFVNERYGKSFTNLNEMKNVLSYNQYRIAKHEYRTSRAKMFLKVRDGAQKVLSELHKIGYYIIMVTARPLSEYPDLMIQTTEWLKKNGLIYDNLFFSEKKHLAILKYFPKVKIVVEDNRRNANDMAGYAEKVFLVENAYNSGETKENIVRIKNLREILEYA